MRNFPKEKWEVQGADRKGFLFRSPRGRAGVLSENPMR